MPLGGVPIGWDEATPAGSESVGLGDDRIRSLKTSGRQGLDSEHYWESSSSTAGGHRPGSGRAFWGTQSQVSSSGDSYSAGRLMVTSNTSRLFSVASTLDGGSGVSHFMVGAGPLSVSLSTMSIAIAGTNNSVPTLSSFAAQYWDMQAGAISFGASNATRHVTFPSAFASVPLVFTSVGTNVYGDGRLFALQLVDASGFTGFLRNSENGDPVEEANYVQWLALGTKAF